MPGAAHDGMELLKQHTTEERDSASHEPETRRPARGRGQTAGVVKCTWKSTYRGSCVTSRPMARPGARQGGRGHSLGPLRSPPVGVADGAACGPCSRDFEGFQTIAALKIPKSGGPSGDVAFDA